MTNERSAHSEPRTSDGKGVPQSDRSLKDTCRDAECEATRFARKSMPGFMREPKTLLKKENPKLNLERKSYKSLFKGCSILKQKKMYLKKTFYLVFYNFLQRYMYI